jgi:hypothetical protein
VATAVRTNATPAMMNIEARIRRNHLLETIAT